MEQFDKAEEAFREAILINDETLPAAAGAFRASLALILAQKGQIDEPQELLKIGEPQVTTHSSELAKFLGKKGQVQLLANDLKAAQSSLDQAKALATEHKFENEGDVAREINELEVLLNDNEA
jgi:hypothetical protein